MIYSSHGETHLDTRPAQAGLVGMPPLPPKAPAGFGCQGPRRPLAGGAACLGLDGQRTAV